MSAHWDLGVIRMSVAHTLDQDSSELTLTDLLAAVADRDPVAWRILVHRHQRLLMHVVSRYRLPPEEVADVVQTTWLRLFENLDHIRDPERLPGWLATTASRVALVASRRG